MDTRKIKEAREMRKEKLYEAIKKVLEIDPDRGCQLFRFMIV
jgi:hypothetical protein